VLSLLILFALAVTTYANSEFLVMTWNVRGYPEKTLERQAWFSDVLSEYEADILCVQEIANDDRVTAFLASETVYVAAAFLNSSDGQDNAIFFRNGLEICDTPDPEGFSHPAQLAYFNRGEFDAYILTVHLAWTDVSQRATERTRLATVSKALMTLDPDLIVAGDFNTTGAPGDTIEGLAEDMGLTVLVPTNDDGTTCAGSHYDYILVSPSIMQAWCPIATVITFDNDTVACEVSDHRPVLAHFDCSGPLPAITTTPKPGFTYNFDFSSLSPYTLPPFLRQGVRADVATQTIAVEMHLQGWRYTMPIPKSPQAAWDNFDGRTTWWHDYWYNIETEQVSATQPVKNENGLYCGDGQDRRDEWRRGGSPKRKPTILEWLLSEYGGHPDVIVFPDSGLETAIREAIGKPTGFIYKTNLIGRTFLNASDWDIANLEGIQHCTSLTRLVLEDNKIVDINPLSGLTNLTELWLYNNKTVDISPLSGLTNLTHLVLGNNKIVDISPLLGLTNLTHLWLFSNQISNISALSGLSDLVLLELQSNQISHASLAVQ
jgi:endonuclease/exonuclease/phosphatase family metal-dependent hydrolase